MVAMIMMKWRWWSWYNTTPETLGNTCIDVDFVAVIDDMNWNEMDKNKFMYPFIITIIIIAMITRICSPILCMYTFYGRTKPESKDIW